MRIFILFCFICPALFLSAANLPPGFVEVPVATGLDPTGMAMAPDGRIFITEKYGAVRIVENGVLLPDPFIQLPVDNYNERGLSGIAIDPDFEQNRYVYLYYTVLSASHNRLIRVQALGNYAIPGSEEVLLELDPLAGTIHNAGAMAFGADGKLYLAVGEGADGTKAPLLTSLLGKVLRLNPDGTIPDDNPFYQQTTGIYRAIYATGLRNPFTLAIQPGTNRIFAGDVGSSFFEEINDIKAGMDYGWNLLEGKRSTQPVAPNYRDPLYYYSHTLGCAVVGGAFYNPPVTQFPVDYVGKYFYGDYCNKRIKLLDPETGLVISTFATDIDRPLVIMTGPQGELYYISRGGLGGGSETDNTSSGEGTLWRVDYVGDGAPIFSQQPHQVLVPIGEDAVFRAHANGTPPISYQWQRNGQDIAGATDESLTLQAVLLADSGVVVRCLAQNGFGQSASQEAVLRVTSNQRPLPAIITPDAGLTYAGGDTVWFSGYAIDPETGDLAEDNLSWRIDLHHDQHTHPGLGPIDGTGSGFYVVPRIGETDDNLWIRIYLTARDPVGLSNTVYREIFPKKTMVHLESTPSGLPIRLDGKTYTTPVDVPSVKGMFRQVQAQPSFPGPDTIRAFREWKDGTSTDPNRAIYADAPVTTLHAVYEDVPLRGTGVYGMYYTLDADTTFGQLAFTRIDTTINFNWENASPDARLGADHFAIRWLGAIEPLFSETHYFHVDTDDGFRLWVDNQLISDTWILKGTSEVNSSIFLEKGRKYPIRLEYFENDGKALARLSWSGISTPKEVLPKKRLFPRLPESPDGPGEKFNLLVAPNPVRNILTLTIDADFQESFNLHLIDASGRMVREWLGQRLEEPRQRLVWPVSDLAPGVYWIELEREGAPRIVQSFVKA